MSLSGKFLKVERGGLGAGHWELSARTVLWSLQWPEGQQGWPHISSLQIFSPILVTFFILLHKLFTLIKFSRLSVIACVFGVTG